MALVDYESKEEKKPLPSMPLIEPEGYKSTLIDTTFTMRSNIITQISGAPWKVDFYSQVLNDDTALNGHAPGKDALNQSYIKTVGYILRVTSPLTASQDTKSNAFNVNGTANTFPFLRPNQGDMFVADIGDGRKGIFRIITTEEKSFYKESTATIDYQLVSYADGPQGNTRFQDLESKVIEVRHFVHEFMDYNQNPFVSTEQYQNYKVLEEAYTEIADNYYRLFTSKKYKSILIPCQKTLTYDSFLVRFLIKAFDGNVTPRASMLKSFNVSEDSYMNLPTLWDALLDRDTDLMNYITTRMMLVPTLHFTREPMLEGIYYSGINETLYPINPIPDIDSTCPDKLKVCVGPSIIPSNDFKSTVPYQGSPLIKKAAQSDYYIFSKDFYFRTQDVSLLEAQTWLYLENKPLNQDVLVALVKEYHQWGSVEKCYYLPILLLLIHSVIRGM